MKKLLYTKKKIRFDSLIKIKDDSKKYTLKYLKESKSVNFKKYKNDLIKRKKLEIKFPKLQENTKKIKIRRIVDVNEYNLSFNKKDHKENLKILIKKKKFELKKDLKRKNIFNQNLTLNDNLKKYKKEKRNFFVNKDLNIISRSFINGNFNDFRFDKKISLKTFKKKYKFQLLKEKSIKFNIFEEINSKKRKNNFVKNVIKMENKKPIQKKISIEENFKIRRFSENTNLIKFENKNKKFLSNTLITKKNQEKSLKNSKKFKNPYSLKNDENFEKKKIKEFKKQILISLNMDSSGKMLKKKYSEKNREKIINKEKAYFFLKKKDKNLKCIINKTGCHIEPIKLENYNKSETISYWMNEINFLLEKKNIFSENENLDYCPYYGHVYEFSEEDFLVDIAFNDFYQDFFYNFIRMMAKLKIDVYADHFRI